MSAHSPPRRGLAVLLSASILLLFVFALLYYALRTPSDESFSLGALAVAFLSLYGGFVLLYIRYVSPEERARNLIDEMYRRHLDVTPETGRDVADDIRLFSSRLDRRRLDQLEFDREARALGDRQVAELKASNRDLVTHHKFTKKMLQSLRSDDVFETLLQGVREGLGFPGAILGHREPGGHIVFRQDAEIAGGADVRVPLWDEGSLVSRTLWSGNSALIESVGSLRHRDEDVLLLGEGPVFLLPFLKSRNVSCADARACDPTDCSGYDRQGYKCWLEGGRTADEATPGDRTRKRMECAGCEIFAPTALLVVRTLPDSRKMTSESILPVVTLGNEASLALEVAGLYENVRTMSITDGLTGLFNHREFYQALHRELERARRYRHSVSLLVIDVDDFKQYNDRFGHPAGDHALRSVSAVIRKCARATDIVCRYGGEEFTVILPESTPGGALMLAERIRTEVAQHRFLPSTEGERRLTVSIGVYSCENGTDSEDQMVKFADEASYRAKHAGKNRVVVQSARSAAQMPPVSAT